MVVVEKQQRVQKLKQAIAEAEKQLSTLVDTPPVPSSTMPAMTAENVGKVGNEATMVKSLPQTPLDALLAGYSGTQVFKRKTNLVVDNKRGRFVVDCHSLAHAHDRTFEHARLE